MQRSPLNSPIGAPGVTIFRILLYYFRVLVLSLLVAANLFPQSSSRNLQQKINKLLEDPFFESTNISIDIFDLTDSIPVFRHNNKLLMHPASNQKILTSITALQKLGDDFQFSTELYHTGIIEGDTLYGDVFVVGGFDPDFSTNDLSLFTEGIASLGIKFIAGGIFGDVSKKDSLYRGNGWMWDDDPDPSAPYLSSLNINDNSIEVFVQPSQVDSPAAVTLIPNTGFVSVKNNCITVNSFKDENFNVTRDWVNRKNEILVDGVIPQIAITDTSKFTEKVNLLKPEKYFLTLLKESFEQKNILCKSGIDIKPLPQNSVYLTSVKRSIDSVLVDVNKDSDNLDAEMLIYAIALKDSGAPAAAENGVEAVYSFIDSLGFSRGDYLIADGSGVSRYNLVSTELILAALKYLYYNNPAHFQKIYSSFSIAGKDGTLEKRFLNTSAENNLHAKTGTLAGVSALSGYVTAKNKNLIAFSIFIQNYTEKNSVARKFIDNICVLLANYY